MDRLINKGWEQMSKTLDREIPVRNSYLSIKYRYVYSIAAVFLLLPIIFIFFNNDQLWVKNNSLVFHLKKDHNNSEIAKITIKTPEFNNSKAVNHQEFKKNEFAPIDKHGSERFVGYVADKINRLSVKVNTKSEKSEIGINNIRYEEIENKDLRSLSNKYPLIKKTKHNNLSFSLSSINKDFSSVAGLDGGLNYTYALSEKLGVSAGIEHTLLSEEINTDDEKFFYYYFNEGINGFEDYVYVKPGSVKNKIYYLGIPVSLLYQVNAFVFSAGFKVSYLLNEKYPEIPDFGENFAEFRIIAFENPKFKNDREKFDYSLIFKLEYMLKKDISIFSKFNYSLKDAFSSQSKSKYDPYYPVAQARSAVTNSNSKDYYFGFGIKYDLINK